LGLQLDGVVKAYSFTRLGQETVMNDLVANLPVVVTFQERTGTRLMFNRPVGTRVLTFVSARSGDGEPLTMHMRAEQTGSLRSGLTGMVLEGTLAGAQLTPVPTTYAFWFAWKDYYPKTSIYGAERPGQ
jgi:hypothetical protein